MILKIQDKKIITNEVKEIAKIALFAIVVEFHNITANKLTELRRTTRKADIHMRVVRNTLMRRVVAGTPFEGLYNSFVGPTLIAFSNTNPGMAAHLFKAFSKDNINFKVKAAAFKGEVLQLSQFDLLALLSTHEKAIARMILIMKEMCIGKLICTLGKLLNNKRQFI